MSFRFSLNITYFLQEREKKVTKDIAKPLPVDEVDHPSLMPRALVFGLRNQSQLPLAVALKQKRAF